jgi:hypothetical protein
MTLLRTSDIFNAIEMHVSDLLPSPLLRIRSGERSDRQVLTLNQARRNVFDPQVDEAVREAIWRELVCPAQKQRGDRSEPSWQLIAAWMVIPGLRRTASRLVHSFRVDRRRCSI